MKIPTFASFSTAFVLAIAAVGCAGASPSDPSPGDPPEVASMKEELHKWGWTAPLYLVTQESGNTADLFILSCQDPQMWVEMNTGREPCSGPTDPTLNRALVVVEHAKGGIALQVVADAPGGGCIHTVLSHVEAGDHISVFALERMPGSKFPTVGTANATL